MKRRKLELSTASADQLAEKAESCRDMSLLVKSNALRKVCKEKTAELTELDKQLADNHTNAGTSDLFTNCKPPFCFAAS